MTTPDAGSPDTATSADAATTAGRPSRPTRTGRTRRRRPALRITLVAIAAALIAAVSAFLVDAHVTFSAERAPVQAVADDLAVHTRWSYPSVVMTPGDDSTGAGLVFFAGAKVDPLAYADKLRGLVDGGTTVVIIRPPLNYAIFEWRPFSDFSALAPEVTEWFVGGHSLGGVKACQYAHDPAVAGLVLLGSYCAGDESGLGKPVVSVSGSNDGLSTPAKIEASRASLPSDTVFVEIEGANHAQFGDYGVQPGDGVSTIDDERMRAQLTAALQQVIPTR
ncbi:alpha/beta hydrolase [Herbiconiux sp. 11R-BC]|uniref:alpha/beta hydrolase n=1 Tax=Herbiconiux sp. 11R-BC TaxID=3111637 RepID=UPI003C0C521F